jgi:hypothetical protein
MTEQEELNEATEALGKCIKTLDRLIARADRKAGALCNEGRNEASAKVRAISGNMRIASGYAVLAYAAGREMQIPGDGGMITPFSGGS